MQFTVADVAGLLGGQVEGDPSRIVNNVAKIQEAKATDIAFLANPKYEPFIYSTGAGAVLVNHDFVARQPISASLIRVADAYSAFTALLEQYQRMVALAFSGVEDPSYAHSSSTVGANIFRGAFSYIGRNCVIGDNVKIHPQVYIGDNVRIGNNVILYPGVKVLKNTIIGSYCTLQAGAVIGSDGFGFAPQPDGSYKTIPQMGNVILEDHVDVGANTVIDCATMGSTIIRRGVKLDNLIQIAHNVEVGHDTVIAAQAGISGSSKIGSNSMIGGQVGIVGHISLPDKTYVGAQAGVNRSPGKEGVAVQGSPAIELKSFHRSTVVFKKLPELLRRVEELEARLIETNIGSNQ